MTFRCCVLLARKSCLPNLFLYCLVLINNSSINSIKDSLHFKSVSIQKVMLIFFFFLFHSSKNFLEGQWLWQPGKNGNRMSIKTLFYSIQEYLFLYCMQSQENFIELQNILSLPDNISIMVILQYMCIPHFIV